ncbi:MAG: hypothetical protein PHW13_10440 [Methylococcales bacterium]|nr:hypothetical protein [Methylococcales bacterium]
MRKQFLMIALAIALPLTAVAATEDNSAAMGGRCDRIDYLTKELSLSAEQKTKLETVFKENKEKFKALHAEKRQQIEAVLNKEQIEKFDKLKKQHHEEWEKKHEDATDKKPAEQAK